uniref:Fibronectin type-III domain-containing protein n=1 Tax=Paramormyrops kingsleyae TaxID=1676925 RepID=A0A3B3R5S9_9TELE
VRCSSPSSTSILVSWQPPPAESRNGIITKYTIQYAVAAGEDVAPRQTARAPPESSRFLLENLNKWTEYPTVDFPERENHYTINKIHRGAPYVFLLSAQNRVGFGAEAVREVATPEDRPASYPRSIRVESASATSALLSWQPLPLAERNGRIIKYGLQYKDINNPQSPTEFIVMAPQSSTTLDGLNPDTIYDVKVCAFTSKGSGPYSPSVQLRTQPLKQGRIPPHPCVPPLPSKDSKISAVLLGSSVFMTLLSRYGTIRAIPSV